MEREVGIMPGVGGKWPSTLILCLVLIAAPLLVLAIFLLA
jgi:hypothetical protein